MIQAKFGLNWPSGFRGEDFWKSLQTDDGRQVMTIVHTGELKSGRFKLVLWAFKDEYYKCFFFNFNAYYVLHKPTNKQ